MLIRNAQIETFQEAALRRFEDEMVAHSREFTPRLCELLGEEQLRVALRQAMERADTFGFTNKGPLRLYIELMFLCGSDFDTDPQYVALGEILRASADQMERAQDLHERIGDYLDTVAGPDNANVNRALRELSNFARTTLRFSSHDFVPGLLREMNRIFPEKVDYVGEAGLKQLIDEGIAEAPKYGFAEVRQHTLIVVLMFAFGHGCTHDPLYPWISRTLQDEKIVDPAARAERLEKKARTWLDHVVASHQG
jgi:hypothetical protein